MTKIVSLVIKGHIVLLVILIPIKWCEAVKFKRPDYCRHLNTKENGSFLWEVKRDPPSYFFGTIHVPYTRVWDHIPENAKKAFALSDRVYFELDLTDPFTISSLTSCQLLPKGANLYEVLPNELFIRLRNHLAYIKSEMPSWITPDQKMRGLHAGYLFNAITGNWKRKRPVWVMLMVNSLTEGDIRCRGVPVLDLFLAQQAEKHKKVVGAVEAVHEQCLPLNKLNYSQGVFALNHTLSQQESIRAGNGVPTHSTDALIEHYNCGNLDTVLFAQDSTQASSLSVPHLSNGSLLPSESFLARNIDDYFRDELILQRNNRMGHRVAAILRDHPDQSFFFAFGAGHFIGSNSILDVVRSSGFRVDQVSPFDKIKRRKRKRGNKNGRVVPKSSVLKNFSPRTRIIHPDEEMDPTFAKFLSERQNRKFFLKDSPSYTTPRRPFNDLWVAIETQELSTTEISTNSEEKSIENSLRIWYGLPTSAAKQLYQRHYLLLEISQLFYAILFIR